MDDHDPLDLTQQARTDALRNRQVKRERLTESEGIKWLMGSRNGRRVMWHLLDHAGVFGASFNLNALQMAHNEGRRLFGTVVLDVVNSECPELLTTMFKENRTDDRIVADRTNSN